MSRDLKNRQMKRRVELSFWIGEYEIMSARIERDLAACRDRVAYFRRERERLDAEIGIGESGSSRAVLQ